MIAKAYIRIAKDKKNRLKVDANSKPNYSPFYINGSYAPTVYFAIEFDVNESLFQQAERTVATINLEMDKSNIGAKILLPAVDKAINEQSLKEMGK